jgi:hypothetical protein
MYHYLEANVVIERIVRHLQWNKFSLLGNDDAKCRICLAVIKEIWNSSWTISFNTQIGLLVTLNVVIQRIVRHLQWTKFSLLGNDDAECRIC